jgi:hypothetical protein
MSIRRRSSTKPTLAHPRREGTFPSGTYVKTVRSPLSRAYEQLPHTVGHRAQLAEVYKGVGAFDERLSLAELWEESMGRLVQRLLLVAADEPLGVDRLARIVNRDVQRLYTGRTKTLALDKPDPPETLSSSSTKPLNDVVSRGFISTAMRAGRTSGSLSRSARSPNETLEDQARRIARRASS